MNIPKSPTRETLGRIKELVELLKKKAPEEGMHIHEIRAEVNGWMLSQVRRTRYLSLKVGLIEKRQDTINTQTTYGSTLKGEQFLKICQTEGVYLAWEQVVVT